MLDNPEKTKTQDLKKSLKLIPQPTGKFEYTDGIGNYFLATENFVLNSLVVEIPCLVATTANLPATYANGASGVGATLTNSGTQAVFAVDGVTPTVGERVLVKDQTSSFQNGTYTVTNAGSISTNWVLTRATNLDEFFEMDQGLIFPVIQGTINGVSEWMLTSQVTTVGTSAVTFVRLSSKNSIQNIQGTANQINVSIVNGVATLSLASNPVFPGTGGATMPGGTTAQRPSTLVAATLRDNNGS